MQTIASYLLETDALPEAEVAERKAAILASIDDWLKSKRADDPTARSGSFRSLTRNGDGRFIRDTLEPAGAWLEDVRLHEGSGRGQTITTQVVATAWNGQVSVYVSLTAENTFVVVAPAEITPRCPKIVRTLLGLSTDWKLNHERISPAYPLFLEGEDAAITLEDDLLSSTRTLPIVVVSQNEGETIWPRLAEEMAHELAALAHVVVVDEAAAFALMQSLGRGNACYGGSVRLYWPTLGNANQAGMLNSTIWTASALLSTDTDNHGCMRFLSRLRKRIMSVAALTITPPVAIREIQTAAARAFIQEVQAKNSVDPEELKIWRMYIDENVDLKRQLAEAKEDIAKLSARAEVAEYAIQQFKVPRIVPEDETDEEIFEVPEDKPPESGETRFYKKIHSKSAYDVLVKVNDCGHTSWQPMAKADKAKKGLERLEGRSDWKTAHHCGTCTGGGMWRIKW